MNNIFVVSGPSGSGKTTLIRMLRDKYRKLGFSVSVTTRKKRDGEKNGKDYHFVKENEFMRMIDNGEFAEWFRIFDNYYGTTLEEIENKSSGKSILLLDIDVNGAKLIKKNYPEAILIFIEPPDHNVLKKRLVQREGKIDSNIKKRLERSIKEISTSGFFDRRIVNDKLSNSFKKLEKIFFLFLNERGLKKEDL